MDITPLIEQNLARMIEHSLLSPTATAHDIRTLCAEAVSYGFYSVCINPSRVALAVQELKDSPVRITTVVGFPLGASTSLSKTREAMDAIYRGAHEIDMVMDIGAALDGDFKRVERDIAEVSCAIRGPHNQPVLKVIIECCYLTDALKRQAIEAAIGGGAEYVKTSTGFGPSGASVEDVRLMREVIKGRARIKAAGGIKTLSDLMAMKEAGADLIGTSSGVAIMAEAGLTP